MDEDKITLIGADGRREDFPAGNSEIYRIFDGEKFLGSLYTGPITTLIIAAVPDLRLEKIGGIENALPVD